MRERHDALLKTKYWHAVQSLREFEATKVLNGARSSPGLATANGGSALSKYYGSDRCQSRWGFPLLEAVPDHSNPWPASTPQCYCAGPPDFCRLHDTDAPNNIMVYRISFLDMYLRIHQPENFFCNLFDRSIDISSLFLANDATALT